MKDLIYQVEAEAFEFKEPWRAADKSLTIIVPIVAKTPGSRSYVVLEEVKDKVKIVDTGSIGESKIEGDVDKPTFIRGGTMLKGATQERATQFGIVVVPQKSEQVPVHCIHASKGIRAGALFTLSGHTPQKVYSQMLAHRNQSQTWAAATRYASMTSVEVPTLETVPSDDLVRVYETVQKFRKDLKEILKGIPDYINQVGTVIIDLDGVYGLEMYDHPDSWKAFSESVMRTFAEALAKEDKTGIFKPDMEAVIPIIQAFLKQIEKAEEEEVFSKHNARTVIIKVEGYVGEYTTLNGKTIHLLVTRREKEQEPERIRPPRHEVFRDIPRRSRDPIYPTIPHPLQYATIYELSNLEAQKWTRKLKPVLNLLEEPKTWTTLASESPIAKATLSTRLKHLQQLGAVEKGEDPNGIVRYRRTAFGQQLLKKH